jgi:hypothetical protein
MLCLLHAKLLELTSLKKDAVIPEITGAPDPLASGIDFEACSPQAD